MTKISLKFLGEPVAKGRPKISSFGGHARAFTPAKTRHAEADLRAQLTPQLPAGWVPMSNPIKATVIFSRHRPTSDKRRLHPHTIPDLDNYLKLLWDALNSTAFVDDALIVEIHARKVFSETPSIEVELEELEARAPPAPRKKKAV